MKKIIATVVSLVVCALMLVGCGNKKEAFAGNYVNVYNDNSAFILLEDGTFMEDADEIGTWDADGKAITIIYSDGEKEIWDIDGEYLVPSEFTMMGTEIPKDGLFDGTFESEYTAYEFFSDGKLLRTAVSSGEIVEASYSRDGNLLHISLPDNNVTMLITNGGINDSAVIKE